MVDHSVELKLSRRQRQVAKLVAEAKSNKLIAHELGLTYGTVKQYLYQLYGKIGVDNRTGLALWAREHLE